MIDLYGLTSPNVQKIFIMLEETGLPYNFKPVDVWASAQYATEFGKLNPNRKIPVIVDRDGPGGRPCTVFESGAILMYLAEKSGRFLPKDTAKKYDAIQWLMIQVTGVGPAFGNFTHFNLFAPKPGNEYAFTRFKATNIRSPTSPPIRGPVSTRPRAPRSINCRTSSAGSRTSRRGRR
jgi:GST-like protein